VDECARRALDICMNSTILNNLERARLLNILLWCGDVAASRVPKGSSPVPVAVRASHDKPVLKRQESETAEPY
jgi:hypothetical protein